MRVARNSFVLFTLLVLILQGINSYAQDGNRTVGVLELEPGTYDGYTLFSPASDTTVYLINSCGQLLHTWKSTVKPGNAVYLHEDGNLYRAGQQINQVIHAGGAGGIIEKFDWEGNVTWSYVYNDFTKRAHHDFQILPNGNILILAWEVKNEEESLNNGRNPDLLESSSLWPEHIVEVKPEGTSGGSIVWEWHSWDHLIQDFDATKENFGVVSDHPEKVDINYTRVDRISADWHHANAINYNEELDQILLSVLYFDEVWIIDHNTTTEEAAGPKGDLMFRWGNPQAYQRGTASDKKLFGQHNAQWIAPGLPDEGKLLIFNNGQERPDGEYTTVIKIDPLFNGNSYEKDGNGNFLPEDFFWEYKQDPPTNFYSRFISGAQQLPNGNILIDDGAHGTFFEINQENEIVWKYVSPVSIFGILEQGSEEVTNPAGAGTNVVFRATKYQKSFTGFSGRNISPGDPIEINGDLSLCIVLGTDNDETAITIFPNPVSQSINIVGVEGYYKLYNLHGHIVKSGVIKRLESVNVSDLEQGVYILDLNGIHQETLLIRR